MSMRGKQQYYTYQVVLLCVLKSSSHIRCLVLLDIWNMLTIVCDGHIVIHFAYLFLEIMMRCLEIP